MTDSQTTVARESAARGVGLHSGADVELRLRPAPAGTGVVFVRDDLPGSPEVRCHPAAVDRSGLQRRTELVGDDGARVITPEHFLAACMGLGLDNVRVHLTGAEIPIFDGSAQEFVALIERAGIVPLETERRPLRLRQPVILTQDDREIIAMPARSMQLAFFAMLTHAGMHNQAAACEIGGEIGTRRFRELACARTFVFYEEIERLRAAGLIRGGSLDCAIVLRDGQPIGLNGSDQPGQYRLPNELACHKLLDLLGDLAVLGRPIDALISARGSGHAMHHEFVELLGKELEE